MTTDKDTIVITGFGLFRNHSSNPSWEAIRDGQLRIDRPNLNIVTREVSVSYEAVDRAVEDLWSRYKPLLMVHVGLAAFEKTIRVEKVARHGPYIHDDIVKFAPHKNLRLYPEVDPSAVGSMEENITRHPYSCKPCQFDSSQSCINIQRACDRLNQSYKEGRTPLPYTCSDDAGLYLCEYIYQKSLKICDRTVFLHVPDVGDQITLGDIRLALKVAIETIIDDINEIQ